MPQAWSVREIEILALIRRGAWFVFCALVLLPLFSSRALAAPWPVKVLRRLVAPFRSHPILQSSATPCSLGYANCFLPNTTSTSTTRAVSKFEPPAIVEDPNRVVTLQLRALHGGPMSHHWLEVESSHGQVTIGFGPATLPFIDAGQISLQDSYGNIERFSGMHPLPVLGLPPLSYRYAKAPGAGHPIGEPISMTIAEADDLIQKERHRKFVGPYIPIFHDCRTFACSVQAHAQGKSTLPCYLLFKGYW